MRICWYSNIKQLKMHDMDIKITGVFICYLHISSEVFFLQKDFSEILSMY